MVSPSHHPAGDEKGTIHWDLKFTLGSITVQASFTLSFTITEPIPPITAGTTSFSGQVGTPLTGNMALSGGTPPYNVAVNDPSTLPPGVTVAADGSVSGTPTQAGTFSVPVGVTDSGA